MSAAEPARGKEREVCVKGGDVVGGVVTNIKWKEFEGREQLSDLPNCVCAAARSERQRLSH